MSLFWVVVITCFSVIASTGICFYLLRKTSDVKSTLWILEHIICPILRIFALLIIVSLIYPIISAEISSIDYWRVLLQEQNINHIINLLFFGSLLLAFIPVAGHPVIALPLQSCLSIALVFNRQFADFLEKTARFMPSTTELTKIILYLIAAYMVTTRSSILLSRWIDKKLVIVGSIRLVSDSIYLVLQIPVMLMYCAFLGKQLQKPKTLLGFAS